MARKTGPKILLISLDQDISAGQRQLLYLAEALDRSEDFDPLLACAETSELANRANELGLPLLPLPGQRKLSPLKLLTLFLYLRRNHPDIVHSHDEKGLDLVALFKKRFKAWGSALVHTRHQALPLTSKTSLRNNLIPPAMVASSRLAAQVAVEAGVPKDRFYIIKPGLDPSIAPARLYRGDGRFVFAVTGPLSPGSGYETLLPALALLKKRPDLPPWEVRVVSPDPIGPVLELAEQHQVQDRLALLGPQDEDLIMAAADAAIFTPSDQTIHQEPMLKAWKNSLPLICSNLPHLREMLKYTYSALVSPVGDIQNLAQSMANLIIDPDLRAQVAAAGHQTALFHTHARMTATYLQLYRKLLRDRNYRLPHDVKRAEEPEEL